MSRKSNASTNSYGQQLANDFHRARMTFRNGEWRSERNIFLTANITEKGMVMGNLDATLKLIAEKLVETKKIYLYGEDIVWELRDGDRGQLVTLAWQSSVDPQAGSILANYIACESDGGDDRPSQQFPLPRRTVDALLMSVPTRAALPKIEHYVRRPMIDDCFVARKPGYHADVKALVHCSPFEPADLGEAPDSSLPILERLPPHLRRLLGDYCFRTDADLVNSLGMFLTGILATHFVEEGKPLFLIDGNQPGVGKTGLAQVNGILLDGKSPTMNRIVSDETELEKQIVASLVSRPSLLIFDNAKTQTRAILESATIESMSVAPRVSGRILGKSLNIDRANDLLWIVTMNTTKVGRDLAARGCAIQLYYEGDPGKRTFDDRSATEYAREHRLEILAEIYGMLDRWTDAGRPDGTQPHRLAKWARLIGGILAANGLPEFLANQETAIQQFDATVDRLASLAEVVLRDIAKGPFAIVGDDAGLASRALAAEGWLTYVGRACVETETINNAQGEHGKRSIVGRILTPLVNRSVEFDIGDKRVRATLRSIDRRSKAKLYVLAVAYPASTESEAAEQS